MCVCVCVLGVWFGGVYVCVSGGGGCAWRNDWILLVNFPPLLTSNNFFDFLFLLSCSLISFGKKVYFFSDWRQK